MAKLKFEIDTDDMFQDYDEEFGVSGESFEQLFRAGLAVEIQTKVTESISKARINEISEKIKMAVEEEVETKMSNLINEDIAMTDRWGKATFIGTVEDFIKKQIDEKMFRQVDNRGNTITGCSSTEDTWVEWKIGKIMGDYISKMERTVERQANDFSKSKLDDALEKFKSKTLSGLIKSRLEAVGVK